MKQLHVLEPKTLYDELEAKAIWNLRLTYYEYHHRLVQPMDYNSLVNNYNWSDTIYFKDYLDELNIAYENFSEIRAKYRLLLNKREATRAKYVDNYNSRSNSNRSTVFYNHSRRLSYKWFYLT